MSLQKEIEKIWNKLKDQPEKGFVVVVKEGYDADAKKYKKVYDPTLQDFLITELTDQYSEWNVYQQKNPAPAGESVPWLPFVRERRKFYGLGPTTYKAKKPSGGPKTKRWWEINEVQLSKGGQFYIVPLIFEDMLNNPFLATYRDPETNIITIIGEGGVLSDEEFVRRAKYTALQKLIYHLKKVISAEKRQDVETGIAALPKNTKPTKWDPNTGEMISQPVAQSYYIDIKNKEYQNLWIKVLFDANWAHSLPDQTSAGVDYDTVWNEVIINIKDLRKHLNILAGLLDYFDAQVEATGVYVEFDGSCTAGSVRQIYGLLEKLMALNEKNTLNELEKTNSALQFGFTEAYGLAYVAFSDKPECLCDAAKNDLDAYVLHKGMAPLRTKGALSSDTVSALIHFLPDIVRRYEKYYNTSTGKFSDDLFNAKESFLEFIETYIYPPKTVTFSDPAKDSTVTNTKKFMAAMELANNPLIYDGLLKGKYVQDPTAILQTDVRNQIIGASNVVNFDGGDAAAYKALSKEIYSIAGLYDNILNNIPISELLKFAMSMILKCMPASKFKSELCKSILATIPLNAIRNQLYPCLQKRGDTGALAIASLEEKISGRTGHLYEVAQERFPEEFEEGEAASESGITKITKLYCSDTSMQKKLGRSPDDFSQEILNWAQEQADEAICDCVISTFGAADQYLAYGEELYDNVVDGLLAQEKNKTKPKAVTQAGTMAIDKFIDPFRSGTTNRIKDFGSALGQSIVDSASAIFLEAVGILIKYVKKEILGDMLTDLCNTRNGEVDKFGDFTSFEDFLSSSPLYEDNDQDKLWDDLNKLGEQSWTGFMNKDVRAWKKTLEKWDKIVTPSEVLKAFNTQCGDQSADPIYEDMISAAAEAEEKQDALLNNPGTSLSEGASGISWNPPEYPNPKDPSDKDPNDPTISKTGLLDKQGMQKFCNGLGKIANKQAIEDAENDYDKALKELTAMCEAGGVINNPEEYGIDNDSFNANTAAGDDATEEEVKTILPLFNKKMLEDSMPPIFCGPCNPRQLDQEPLMSSPNHPSQMYMVDELNQKTYAAIDTVFNNNISVYKQLISELGDPGFANDLSELLAGQTPPDGWQSAKEAAAEYEKSLYGDPMTGDKGLLDLENENKDNLENFLVAKTFRNNLEGVLGQKNKTTAGNLEDGWFSIAYDIPSTAYEFHLIINFSDEKEVNSTTKSGVPYAVAPMQIKFLVINGYTIEFEWPKPNEENEKYLKNFNFSDLEDSALWGYFSQNSNASDVISQIVGTYNAKNPNSALLQLWPVFASLILETVWTNATQKDLFLSKNFNSVPFTNAEALSKCQGDTLGSVPLLNTSEVRKEVDDMRRALECVISPFEKFDAIQTANMFGMYKIMIKVCVIEEYLKNIFLFAFVKISDIIESDVYMELVKDNVRVLTESALGDGYEQLKNFSQKLVEGRKQLGEYDDDSGVMAITDPEDALEQIIRETAIEIDNILDDRLKSYVSGWKDKFISTELFETGDSEAYFTNNFFQYAINAVDWEAERYPSMKYKLDSPVDHMAWLNKPPGFEMIGGLDKLTNDIPGPPDPPSYDWSSPLPKGTTGGLFWEPYIRLRSKLKDSVNLADAPDFDDDNLYHRGRWAAQQGILDFWEKFKMAFEQKLKRDYIRVDEINYDSSSGAGFNFQTHDGVRASLAEDNTNLDQIQWNDLLQEYTYGASDTIFEGAYTVGDDEELSEVSLPVGSSAGPAPYSNGQIISIFFLELIKEIDEEFKNAQDSVKQPGHGLYRHLHDTGAMDGLVPSKFWRFMEAFFSCVHGDGGKLPKYVYSNHGAGQTFFQRVLSSFSFEEPSADAAPSLDLEKEWFFGDILGKNKNKSLSSGPWGDSAWYHQYFYWDHFPFGVPYAGSGHFRNRGVIPFHIASYGANRINFAHMNTEDELPDMKWGAWTGKDSQFVDIANTSTIGLFARSREFKMGNSSPTDNWMPIESNTGAIASGKYLETIMDFIGNRRDGKYKLWNAAWVNSTIEQYMMTDHGNEGVGVSQTTFWESPTNVYWACHVHDYMKDIFASSAFDDWFDINLGMRLNMIIPIGSSEEYESIKGLLSSWIEGVHTTLGSSPVSNTPGVAGKLENDGDYSDDKVFLLSAPKSGAKNGHLVNDCNYWICMPLSFVEHSLSQFWKDIYSYGSTQEGTSVKTLYTADVLKAVKAANPQNNTSPAAIIKNNPWWHIMKNINELGNKNQQWKYGWRYRTLQAQEEYNLWHNLHVPEKITNFMADIGIPDSFGSTATASNFERPNLWAACKMINTGLSHYERLDATNNLDDDLKINKDRKLVIDTMKQEILNKIQNENSTLLQEILPIEESVYTTAFLYRYIMESSYPTISNLFSPTKDMINAMSTQMLRAVDGDYQYQNDRILDETPGKNAADTSPSTGDIAVMFLKLCVQAAANTTDPTWKTPWFFPGPITPIGIIAKILSRKSGAGDNNKDNNTVDSIGSGNPDNQC